MGLSEAMFSLPQACFPSSFLLNVTSAILRVRVTCENGWVLQGSLAVRNRPLVKSAGSEPWCRLLLSWPLAGGDRPAQFSGDPRKDSIASPARAS